MVNSILNMYNRLMPINCASKQTDTSKQLIAKLHIILLAPGRLSGYGSRVQALYKSLLLLWAFILAVGLLE